MNMPPPMNENAYRDHVVAIHAEVVCPRADGAKRRARELIPHRLFTPGEREALAKSKVHQ